MTDSPLKSPAKGLEKLATELRQERLKCTNALQERAKLKIEIEKLKHNLSDAQEELLNSQENYRMLSANYSDLEQKVTDLESALESKQQELRDMSYMHASTSEELENAKRLISSLNNDVEEAHSANSTTSSVIEELRCKLASKIQFIKELEDETRQLKSQSEIQAGKIKDLSHELDSSNVELDKMKVQTDRIEALTNSYEELKESCDEVRLELENALQRNAELSVKFRDSQETIRIQSMNEQKQKQEIASMNAQIAKLKKEVNDFDRCQEELSRRADAEAESAQIARDKASDAIRSREHLERQIASLKAAHEEALHRCEEKEEEAVHLNSRILTLQSDLAVSQERAREREAELVDAQGQKALANEVESLRGQLADMRKKLLRKELDDEVDKISPAAAMERERGNRRVYESIIEDLREQLEKSNSAHHDAVQKLNDAKVKLMRMEELEEEMELYKETAKKVAIESHSVVNSVSEAQERNERTAHEMHIRMRDLKVAEGEVHSLKVERDYLTDEIENIKTRLREVTLEKLGAERKLSEATAKAARSEAASDSYKLRAESSEHELTRLKRLVSDQQSNIEDLKAKRAESDKQRLALLEKLHGSATKQAPRVDDRKLDLEIEKLRQEKDTLQREIATLTKSLKAQKQVNSDQLMEIDRLLSEIDRLHKEKEVFRRDMSLHESGKTELQLVELRRELEKTVDDWKDSEKERASREETVGQLQLNLEKEKERTALLQTQINILEDRINVMGQELAVFHSLDVYHTSMNAELKSHRNPQPSIRNASPERVGDSKRYSYHSLSRKGSIRYTEQETSSDSSDEDFPTHRSVGHEYQRTHTFERSPQLFSRQNSDVLSTRGSSDTRKLYRSTSSVAAEEDKGPALEIDDISPALPLDTANNVYRRFNSRDGKADITPSLSKSGSLRAIDVSHSIASEFKERYGSVPESSASESESRPSNTIHRGAKSKPPTLPSTLLKRSAINRISNSSDDDESQKYVSQAPETTAPRALMPDQSNFSVSRPNLPSPTGAVKSQVLSNSTSSGRPSRGQRLSRVEFDRAKKLLSRK